MCNVKSIMATYLSFDCANKSLAWSHITFDTDILNKLAALFPSLQDAVNKFTHQDNNLLLLGIIGRFRSIMSGFIRYHSSGVVDLLDGALLRDVDETARTVALHNFLTQLDGRSPNIDTDVLIERQNNIGAMTNRASTIVSAQLAYHYVSRDVIYVNPSLKNKLTLAPHLDICEYVARELPRHKNASDARYAANKKQSRDTFVYMCDLLGHSYVYESVSRTYWDDLADSTMQAVAIVRGSNLLVSSFFS